MIGLIILDLYGTIVKPNSSPPVRDGFDEFIQHYRGQGAKIVISTDGPEETVIRTLYDLDLWDKVDEVYDNRDCFPGDSGRTIKNLKKSCYKFSVDPSNAVFIGDNFYGGDQESADHYEMRFVKVPQYREEPPSWQVRDSLEYYVDFEDPENPFSFRSLIGKL